MFACASVLLIATYEAVPALAQPSRLPAAAQRQRPLEQPPQAVPGALRWSTNIGGPTWVPPVMTDRQVFAALPSGVIASFGIEDGAELWRVELKPDHPLVVDENVVYVSQAGVLHALRAASGALLWRQTTGPLNAPLLVHQGWVITITTAEVVARRAADGAIVWSRPSGPQHKEPTIEGDTLYLPLDGPALLALDVTTGALKWERAFRGAPSEVSALAGRVYVGSEDKFFYCLDAKDGVTKWRHRVGAAVIGRPVLDTGRVYFVAMDNAIRALDRVDGAIKWQAGLPFRPSAEPRLFGTAVVVPGTAAELLTFNAVTGKPGRKIALSAPLASPLDMQPSAKGPLAVTITGSLDVEWTLSVWEPSMAIPTAPLTVLPGTAVPLQPAPLSRSGAP